MHKLFQNHMLPEAEAEAEAEEGLFYRNTGENDPYDMSIAPLNLFENQVIPIGLHNLSKSLGQIYPPFEFYR